MRLIDADALMDYLGMSEECDKCIQKERDCRFNNNYSLMDFCSAIEEMPTIEVEQTKRAKWIECQWISSTLNITCKAQKCSFCESVSIPATNYCPNCGARMVEE